MFFQVLQKRGHPDIQRNKKSSMGFSSHFLLPQILICIFKFLDTCKDSSTRMKILKDLLNLLDSNPSNIEDLMVKLEYLLWFAILKFFFSEMFYRNMVGLHG